MVTLGFGVTNSESMMPGNKVAAIKDFRAANILSKSHPWCYNKGIQMNYSHDKMMMRDTFCAVGQQTYDVYQRFTSVWGSVYSRKYRNF